MRLGIDLDGVAYDFVADARDVCASDLGVDPASLAPVVEWNFPLAWGYDMVRFWEVIYQAVDEGRVWQMRPPFPGTIEALTLLRDQGHTIHIGTSRGGAEIATFEWLTRFDIPTDSVTITKDKTVLDVDLFLEDYEGNHAALTEAGTPCVLMDQPWNRHVLWADRVHSWFEFVTYVDEAAPRQVAA